MKDPFFVALMLSSLQKSFDGLIVALESRPDEDLTVDYVKGKLLVGRRRADGADENKELLLWAAVRVDPWTCRGSCAATGQRPGGRQCVHAHCRTH